MPAFAQIEGSVVLRTRGRFKATSVHALKDELYAKDGASFIRLKGNGGTSLEKTHWSDLDIEVLYRIDRTTQHLVVLPPLLATA